MRHAPQILSECIIHTFKEYHDWSADIQNKGTYKWVKIQERIQLYNAWLETL